MIEQAKRLLYFKSPRLSEYIQHGVGGTSKIMSILHVLRHSCREEFGIESNMFCFLLVNSDPLHSTIPLLIITRLMKQIQSVAGH